jgi:hypothetical protein
LPWSKQYTAPKHIEKIHRIQNVDAIARAAAFRLAADDDPPASRGMLMLEFAQTFKVMRLHAGGGFALDGALQVVHDEVHLDARAQTPEAELGKTLTIAVVAAERAVFPDCRGPERKNISVPGAGSFNARVKLAIVDCDLHENRDFNMRFSAYSETRQMARSGQRNEISTFHLPNPIKG